MRRLPGEDLPVKLFGLEQPPGLVVLQCQVERLLDCYLGHAANGWYLLPILLTKN
jgi:hypothetical protein